MCDGFCNLLSLFILRFTIVELFKQKHKKIVGRYIGTSLSMYQNYKTIEQSFMKSLKIDLQQTHIDFKIFPTKIDVHTKQAKHVNALRH